MEENRILSNTEKLDLEDLENVSGGVKNKAKLEAYIRQRKAAGDDVDLIIWHVCSQPLCFDFLDYDHDANGNIYCSGDIPELMDFTRDFYNSVKL